MSNVIESLSAYFKALNEANYYLQRLDKKLTEYPVLNKIEQRTQVPKNYLVIGTVSFLTLSLSVNLLAAPTSNLVGWALPTYLSFKTLETSGSEENMQWLIYWVIFGLFIFLESIALRMILYCFPWYFIFKTALILWLQLPTFRGARTIYVVVLKSVLSNSSGSRTIELTHSSIIEDLTATSKSD